MKNFQFSISGFQKEKGFALFIAIVITGVLLLIATGIIALSVRQSIIADAGRQSQLAFYAADTGMECALYWDIHNPSGHTAFDPATGASITCNKDAANSGNQWVVGGNAVSTFGSITFLPDPYCATVTVTKSGNSTVIESHGYNTCDATNLRRVERAVRAEY